MHDLRRVPRDDVPEGERRLNDAVGVADLCATLARLQDDGWDVLSIAVIEEGPPTTQTVTVLATAVPPQRQAPTLRVVKPAE